MFFLEKDASPWLQVSLQSGHSLYFFAYYQALVYKHIFPHQLPPGFMSFSSACKKMFFNFLLEQHASSTADILVRVNLSPCQMCYFSHSPSCFLWVPHSSPAHLSPPLLLRWHWCLERHHTRGTLLFSCHVPVGTWLHWPPSLSRAGALHFAMLGVVWTNLRHGTTICLLAGCM